MSPPLAIYALVAEYLADVAPTYLGRKYLAQHDSPRRYVWVFTGEESAGAARVGGNPRARHVDRWSVEVHCWGADFEEAYRLRQVLITRLRTSVSGKNYELGRTVILSDEEHSALGSVFVVGLTLITPLSDAAVTEASAIHDDVRPVGHATTVDRDAGGLEAHGDGAPAVTITGDAATPVALRVEVDHGGALGSATFRYSIDAGLTWEATGVPTAPTCALLGTGLELHFPSGDYLRDHFYLLSTLAPKSGDGLVSALEE